MLLLHLALYIPFLPALLGVFKWKSLSQAQCWFVWMLCAILVISISGELWQKYSEHNNLPFFHVYILIEYFFLLQIFKLLLGKSLNITLWYSLRIGFLVLWILNVSINNGWWGFPDYIHALEALIVLSLVVMWLAKTLREKVVSNPEKTFEFWFCSGLLVFFSGNFLLFFFSTFLLSIEMAAYDAIWKVHCILIIILYVLYTVALLWIKKIIK